MSTRDVLLTLGRVALAGGDVARAIDVLGEALPLCVEFGQPYELSQCLRALASVASLAGAHRRAAVLFGAADAVRDPGAEVFPVEPDLADHRDRTQRSLGDHGFATACREGSTMALDDVTALATVPPEDQVSASSSDRSTRS
jgi:hypothetical protein